MGTLRLTMLAVGVCALLGASMTARAGFRSPPGDRVSSANKFKQGYNRVEKPIGGSVKAVTSKLNVGALKNKLGGFKVSAQGKVGNTRMPSNAATAIGAGGLMALCGGIAFAIPTLAGHLNPIPAVALLAGGLGAVYVANRMK